MRLIRALVPLVLGLCLSWARAGSYEDWFKAVHTNDARAARALLERGFDPNTRDAKGQVALYLALREDGFDVAALLLSHPALQIDALNPAGETPLMMAALRGNLSWTERLLARGARLHQEGWSPILYAASGPEPKVVQLLLDRGAPVDARSLNGTTPLMMAAHYGAEASVDLLLKR
ncbi:MAG TPA: ankyrin repeat domain-containing protein, partial [Burkholderiaceae bacterium]|nr:ankyrin repeat domain-containing protein [Burkholderiaceae bacterium]